MKRHSFFFLGIILLLLFGLIGCGSKPSPDTVTKKGSITIKQGSDNLLNTANQIKKAIEANNTQDVQKLGAKLEENWSVYEDRVKTSYPALYEKVESYLDPAVAGSKAATLDKSTLETLFNHLIKTVQELEKKAGK